MAEETCKLKCTKDDGSHDHRCNTGNDRTPTQKNDDKKKVKARN